MCGNRAMVRFLESMCLAGLRELSSFSKRYYPVGIFMFDDKMIWWLLYIRLLRRGHPQAQRLRNNYFDIWINKILCRRDWLRLWNGIAMVLWQDCLHGRFSVDSRASSEKNAPNNVGMRKGALSTVNLTSGGATGPTSGSVCTTWKCVACWSRIVFWEACRCFLA